ncbi:MAG: serpin family protein [archaeon]
MAGNFLTVGVILFILASAVVATALYLFPYEPKQPPKANDTGATKQGIQEVVNANNKFAFDLYSKSSKSPKYEDKNIFYSPHSIFAALTITYEGARGQTAQEMKSVLYLPENAVLRPNFAAIYNSINEGSKDYELRTGNALWVQHDFPLLKEYTSVVEEYYGGKATNLDFVKEPEKSRQTINSFIEEQTNGKIKDLIPPEFINKLTRLVITNAIYFKGTWVWEFDPKNTHEEDFKITQNNIVKVPMMCMYPKDEEFNYADLEELQILELPYKGEKISMLILLPKNKSLSDFESSLTLQKLEEYYKQMQKTKLEYICLPKFEFETKYFLNEILEDLGMKTAFTNFTDFSGMTSNRGLYISTVIHQAYIKVDEKGTEAAGATAVVIAITAHMPEKVFKADHPFIFVIQQKDTGNILFIGRVVDPTRKG